MDLVPQARLAATQSKGLCTVNVTAPARRVYACGDMVMDAYYYCIFALKAVCHRRLGHGFGMAPAMCTSWFSWCSC